MKRSLKLTALLFVFLMPFVVKAEENKEYEKILFNDLEEPSFEIEPKLKQIKELNTLFFNNPTEEWVDFVMKNRTQKDFQHNYDVVYGPVANDRVYAAFALYEGGLIDILTLISDLKTYKLVDQYLFHTEQSLKALKFIEAEEIKL